MILLSYKNVPSNLSVDQKDPLKTNQCSSLYNIHTSSHPSLDSIPSCERPQQDQKVRHLAAPQNIHISINLMPLITSRHVSAPQKSCHQVRGPQMSCRRVSEPQTCRRIDRRYRRRLGRQTRYFSVTSSSAVSLQTVSRRGRNKVLCGGDVSDGQRRIQAAGRGGGASRQRGEDEGASRQRGEGEAHPGRGERARGHPGSGERARGIKAAGRGRGASRQRGEGEGVSWPQGEVEETSRQREKGGCGFRPQRRHFLVSSFGHRRLGRRLHTFVITLLTRVSL